MSALQLTIRPPMCFTIRKLKLYRVLETKFMEPCYLYKPLGTTTCHSVAFPWLALTRHGTQRVCSSIRIAYSSSSSSTGSQLHCSHKDRRPRSFNCTFIHYPARCSPHCTSVLLKYKNSPTSYIYPQCVYYSSRSFCGRASRLSNSTPTFPHKFKEE